MKKTVWFITRRGFGSEMNFLLYAIHYLREKSPQTKLFVNSNFSSLSYKNGLSDYFADNDLFKTFDIEKNSRTRHIFRVIHPFNFNYCRYICIKQIAYIFLKKGMLSLYHLQFNRIKCFSDERRKDKNKYIRDINDILNDIWRFNPQTRQSIADKIKELDIKGEYLAFHIRRGDKKSEAELIEVANYMDRVKKLNTETKNIFVMTDDYLVIEELQKDYSEYKFFTLCTENQQGYHQNDFNRTTYEKRKEAMLTLLADIEIAKQAEFFIGMSRSNLSILIEYFMTTECHNI